MTQKSKVQSYVMPIFTALYSIIGLIYLDWGVFHIVYLFWFENLVRIISYRFKLNALEFVSFSGNTQPVRDTEGRIYGTLKQVFQTRLFMYFVYFVFIVVGLGIVLPMIETDNDTSFKGLYNFVRVFTFRDWDFNLALITCVMDEFMSYLNDFKKHKRYSRENPFRVPVPFEKEDVILHLSIIFTAVFAFFFKHPDSPVQGIVTCSPMIAAGIILVLFILGFQIYTVRKGISEQEEANLKKTISERTREIQNP